MPNHAALSRALEDLARNPEQLEAARAGGNCVVLAGPGSGKTKTLTTAMTRTLVEDVAEPSGVACITYNNECSIELEDRLARLGIESGGRVFIRTVHGFALSQVLSPYARCFPEILPADFRVASTAEARAAVEFDGAKRAPALRDVLPQALPARDLPAHPSPERARGRRRWQDRRRHLPRRRSHRRRWLRRQSGTRP